MTVTWLTASVHRRPVSIHQRKNQVTKSKTKNETARLAEIDSEVGLPSRSPVALRVAKEMGPPGIEPGTP